ncbi:MAG: hypothetical protein ACJ8C4_21055 [Gemmataceae bacterium]
MSQLLEHALAEVRKLSDAEQEAIAALILAEIEDDRLWEESFARSTDKLKALADRAVEQVRAGECRAAGFDEL